MCEGFWIGDSIVGFEIGVGYNLFDCDFYFFVVDCILWDEMVMY